MSQSKNQPDSIGGFLVRLQPTIFPFSVTIRTDFTLVLAAPKFCILGSFILNRKVPTIQFVNQIAKRNINTACVAPELSTIISVIEGDKADIVQRKYSLQVIFDLDTIAAKTRKILDNNAVDGPLLHQVKQFLDTWKKEKLMARAA